MDLQEIINIVKYQHQDEVRSMIQDVFREDSFVLSYNGRVQVKERPRHSKGRTYTPEKTRKFEAAVKKWAEKMWDRGPLGYPIRVDLMVNEECLIPQTLQHGLWGLVYNQKGDVDNLGKSILDGMNGVVYKDDKQIVDLRIERCYSREHGFDVIIQRAGLSPLEYRNFVVRTR